MAICFVCSIFDWTHKNLENEAFLLVAVHRVCMWQYFQCFCHQQMWQCVYITILHIEVLSKGGQCCTKMLLSRWHLTAFAWGSGPTSCLVLVKTHLSLCNIWPASPGQVLQASLSRPACPGQLVQPSLSSPASPGQLLHARPASLGQLLHGNFSRPGQLFQACLLTERYCSLVVQIHNTSSVDNLGDWKPWCYVTTGIGSTVFYLAHSLELWSDWLWPTSS